MRTPRSARLVLSVIVLTLAVLSVAPSPASAAPCGIDSSALGCGDTKPGGPPAPPSGSQPGSPGAPSNPGGSGGGGGGGGGDCNCHYIREYTGITMVTGPGGVTVPAPAPGFCIDPATGQQGVPYNDYRVDNTTGERTLIGSGCEVPGTPPPGQVPGEQGSGPAAPPPPPGPEEVAKKAPLPTPSFSLNPTPGLTGLATLLWTTDTGPVTVALPPINGYALSASAHPVAYRWIMGDGVTVVGTGPGSATSPSATHVYESKGDVTITLEVVWAGTYTATFPGQPGQTFDLGTVTRQGSQPYHVIEVRSVLTSQ